MTVSTSRRARVRGHRCRRRGFSRERSVLGKRRERKLLPRRNHDCFLKPMTRVFLLSPAYAGGQRARIIMSERAQFDLARRLRSNKPPTLGEVFARSEERRVGKEGRSEWAT